MNQDTHYNDPFEWPVGSLAAFFGKEPYAYCSVQYLNTDVVLAVVSYEGFGDSRRFKGETARQDAVRWAEDSANKLRSRSSHVKN